MPDALIEATRSGKMRAVREAVAANPKAARHARAVVAAARQAFQAALAFLLSHGADLNRATANGKPLQNDLIRWGQIPRTLWLLARGASPHIAEERGWTAVDQAASRGNLRLREAVLEAGGDCGRRDREGASPLDIAAQAGRGKLAARLAV